MSEVKLVHRWEYDGKEFPNKRAVIEYKAKQTLGSYGTVDQLIANADAVIEALKPFATPKRRQPRKVGNGAAKAKARTATQAEATA